MKKSLLFIAIAFISAGTVPAYAVSPTAIEKANANACKDVNNAAIKEKQLCVSQTSITFTSDGCTFTVDAAPGASLVYGTYIGGYERGWSSQPVSVPDSGTITASTGGIKGMSSFATVKDEYNNELITQSALIITDGCEISPDIQNGGYPSSLSNAALSSIVDQWGMYNRESTSYAAFKTYATGKYMPYWGAANPNQWDDRAIYSGIPVDSTPQAGDIAVSNAGYYGHVFFVEKVNEDGTVKVSHYNASWTGLYAVSTVNSAALKFIHFPSQY